MKETALLAKVVKEDKLTCLIVNLYPGSEGYSLMLPKADGSEVETVKLPYDVGYYAGRTLMCLMCRKINLRDTGMMASIKRFYLNLRCPLIQVF